MASQREGGTVLSRLRAALAVYDSPLTKAEVVLTKESAADLLADRVRDFFEEVDGIASGKVVNINE